MAARNAYFPLFIILNRWKIKGRPFDSEGGGGWQILSGQTIYFHHGLGRIIYLQVYQGQTIYYAPIVETKFLELAMSLLDFSSRIPLGTFSILLSTTSTTTKI